MPSKRPNETDEPVDENDMLEFVALGGGSEVGRSCHIVSYKGKTIMLDAGVHPAYSGLSGLPFYDEYDLSTVDILLISHFHVDHAASLPYVMQHTDFKGRVFMTHPTKAILRWLLSDFVRVANGSNASGNAPLYTDVDLANCFDKIEVVDYHSTMEVDGIKFTAYHAGHVLGAAMFFVEVGNVKFLFTGDYSREENRHLSPAEVPPKRPDILISESTYGTSSHLPRNEKENRLTSIIYDTVTKGGRVLMPVFALGNAQEILLILDEYWDSHPELDNVNIYYASSLARKCLAVYQTYINMMNPNIRKRIRDHHTNPFHFRHVRNLRNLEKFDDIGPCVMLASPGMLQNGFSRELLERWCPDSKNTLLMTGYSVEGTMAKQIINEPTEIPSMVNSNTKIPRRCLVEEISFAAHVDYQQNSHFIELVNPSIIILVHGEANNMGRLKSALLSKYQHLKNTTKEVKIFNPKNCEEVRLPFRSIKIAKTMGVLAEKQPVDGQILTGIAVQKDFEMSILAPVDLKEYTALTTTVILERQNVIVEGSTELIKFHLEQMFGSVTESNDKDGYKMTVMDAVSIQHKNNVATIEWAGNAVNDTLADCVVGILLSVDSSPTSVRLSSQPCSHNNNGTVAARSHRHHLHDNISNQQRQIQMLAFLQAQFGDAISAIEEKEDDDAQKQSNGNGKEEHFDLQIEIDGRIAKINLESLHVQCDFVPLAKRVSHILDQSADTIAPLSAVIHEEEYKEIQDTRDIEMSDVNKESSGSRIQEQVTVKSEGDNDVKTEPGNTKEQTGSLEDGIKPEPEKVEIVPKTEESALETPSANDDKKPEIEQSKADSATSEEKARPPIEDKDLPNSSDAKSDILKPGAAPDEQMSKTKDSTSAQQADFKGELTDEAKPDESTTDAGSDKMDVEKPAQEISNQKEVVKEETTKEQDRSTAEHESKVGVDESIKREAIDQKEEADKKLKIKPGTENDIQTEATELSKCADSTEVINSEKQRPSDASKLNVDDGQKNEVGEKAIKGSNGDGSEKQDVEMTEADNEEGSKNAKFEQIQAEPTLPEGNKVESVDSENVKSENAKMEPRPSTPQDDTENIIAESSKSKDADPQQPTASLETAKAEPLAVKGDEKHDDSRDTDNSKVSEIKPVLTEPEAIKTEDAKSPSAKTQTIEPELKPKVQGEKAESKETQSNIELKTDKTEEDVHSKDEETNLEKNKSAPADAENTKAGSADEKESETKESPAKNTAETIS